MKGLSFQKKRSCEKSGMREYTLSRLPEENPCFKGDYRFTERLIEEGHKVLIETNGSLSIQDIDRRVVVILDMKTPASGMSEKMDFANLRIEGKGRD